MNYIFLILIIIFSLSSSVYSNEKVLFSKNDKSNPLHVWNLDITNYWKELSDKILAHYKNIQLTPHQKAVIFLDYTSEYKLGFPVGGAEPKNVIKEKTGACGTFTNVFLALMRVNDIQGRIVNLYNFPKDTGHTVAEVFYDNKWHLYDTTYAAFFSFNPSDMLDPKVLSFKELKNLQEIQKVFRTIINYKRFYKYRSNAEKYVSFDIYKKANPSGPIGLKNKMYFPIYLDLKKKNTINKKDFGPKNQGAGYIGVAGINQNSKYIISGLTKNKKYAIILEPNFIGGDKNLNSIDLQLTSQDCNLLKQYYKYTNNGHVIKLNFIAAKKTCNIIVDTNLSGEYKKYISLKSIKIIEELKK